MNSDLKQKVEAMKANSFGQPDKEANTSSENSAENYSHISTIRNLCFEWQDGRKLFLNYSYLVTGEFIPQDQSILLIYTTHKVTIKGTFLFELFAALQSHIPRIVKCSDDRYISLEDENTQVITAIETELIL